MTPVAQPRLRPADHRRLEHPPRHHLHQLPEYASLKPHGLSSSRASIRFSPRQTEANPSHAPCPDKPSPDSSGSSPGMTGTLRLTLPAGTLRLALAKAMPLRTPM